MPLTVKQVQSKGPGRFSDGRGLYLLVKPSGERSWVLRVQHDGTRYDRGLGAAVVESVSSDLPVHRKSSLTLAEAREKARIGRELMKAGITDLRKHWKAEVEAPMIPSFERAARDFHKEVSKGWRNGKHGAQWLSTLEAYVFPAIGANAVDKIEASDVQRVLLPIWLTKGETARRIRQRVLAVLDYAHAKGWRPAESPARAVAQLMNSIKQPKASNFAAMPWSQVPSFMAKLNGEPDSIGRLALQFLILTAARSGEVRKAEWSEIDWEAKEWVQPASHTKANRPHIVPLTPSAMAILKRLRGLLSADPKTLIFPGNKGKVMSDATMAKVLKSANVGDYTVHGFRSSFRDWAAETGQPDAWAEAALAHGVPDKVEAAYRRTVFFQQRRDKLMPAWESFLSEPSNLVSLSERRG